MNDLVNESVGLVNGLVNEDCTSKMVAQPEPCEDAVSRAKVMNRIDRIIEVNKLNPSLVWFTPNGVKALIAELPSVQPELIRCKECKHRYVDGDGVRYNVCELNHNKVQSDDWFCADAERREGEING